MHNKCFREVTRLTYVTTLSQQFTKLGTYYIIGKTLLQPVSNGTNKH